MPSKANLIQTLKNDLNQSSSAETKEWFENYLKGVIKYRGVKTPEVTKIVSKWAKEHKILDLDFLEQLDLATALIHSEYAEDKFSGTIFIQKFLLAPMLKSSKEDSKSKQPFEASFLLEYCDTAIYQKGAFYDWSTNDWFVVRVLDQLLAANLHLSSTFLDWASRENLWQRRSAILAFRHAAKDTATHEIIEKIIDKLVIEKERFIQTGIGWLISDLSKSHHDKAAALVDKHRKLLSKEVLKRHTKFLQI
jgi:3-methyladenine DNA glycosylase AlkD